MLFPSAKAIKQQRIKNAKNEISSIRTRFRAGIISANEAKQLTGKLEQKYADILK